MLVSLKLLKMIVWHFAFLDDCQAMIFCNVYYYKTVNI